MNENPAIIYNVSPGMQTVVGRAKQKEPTKNRENTVISDLFVPQSTIPHYLIAKTTKQKRDQEAKAESKGEKLLKLRRHFCVSQRFIFLSFLGWSLKTKKNRFLFFFLWIFVKNCLRMAGCIRAENNDDDDHKFNK